ncbi:hypothetical protein L7F22_006787 [Adiantum nelumboides]|nr:hypothetical protein [Adiantum nelumboides]
MGSGEMGTPTKTTKTSTPQEQTPPAATTTSAMSYPEWAAALQAYYSSGMSPLPHPGYYPSTMGSAPQPHPYMWGAQPMVPPPFGTPPPYAALYPHGGMYGHPPMTPVATSVGTDAEAKSDEKKKSSKKSKGSLGSLGMLTGKTSDMSKANAVSINGALSNSGDSGSEGSSDGSEGLSGEGSQELRKNSFDQATSEVPNSHMISPYGSAQDPMGNHAQAAMPISIGGKQVVGAGPVTNLNIGMDYWSGGTPGLLANNRGGKRASMAGNTTALIPSTANAVSGELWMQIACKTRTKSVSPSHMLTNDKTAELANMQLKWRRLVTWFHRRDKSLFPIEVSLGQFGLEDIGDYSSDTGIAIMADRPDDVTEEVSSSQGQQTHEVGDAES